MKEPKTRDPLAQEIDRMAECYECEGGGLACVRRCFLANARLLRRDGSTPWKSEVAPC